MIIGEKDEPNRNELVNSVEMLWNLIGKEEIYVYLKQHLYNDDIESKKVLV